MSASPRALGRPILAVPPLIIGGAIRVTATLGIKLGGRLCLLDRKVEVQVTPQIGLEIGADVFVQVLVVRGGISFELQLFSFGLGFLGGVVARDGFSASTDIFTVMVGPRFCLMAFVAFPGPKFCGPVPCGITWGTRIEKEITCTSINLPGVCCEELEPLHPPPTHPLSQPRMP